MVSKEPEKDRVDKNPRARSNPFKSAIRLIFLTFVTFGLVLCYKIHGIFLRDEQRRVILASRYTHIWGKISTRVAGIKLEISGQPPVKCCFLAPNHTTYADIMILMAATRCVFISRADVEKWPVLGFGARASGQIFLLRKKQKGMLAVSEQICRRLESGETVCTFLEGTTSGKGLLPFRSSFLQPAIESGAEIIPTAIKWSSINPEINLAEDVAYWKNHVFFPHAFRFFGLKGLGAKIIFGSPVSSKGRDRKRLARETEKAVKTLLENDP